MLNMALTFLIFSLVAAVFGFGGVAAVSVGAAKICFFVFLGLFLLTLLGLRRGDKLLGKNL